MPKNRATAVGTILLIAALLIGCDARSSSGVSSKSVSCEQFEVITDYPFFEGRTRQVMTTASEVDEFCNYRFKGNWDIKTGACNSAAGGDRTYPIRCLNSAS